MPKQKTIKDQLKAAIKASGLTYYRISKDAGITETAIARFMSGERGLNIDTAAKICAALNLELRKRNS
jgi:transcriptional regulator with XRE-family HTH domain